MANTTTAVVATAAIVAAGRWAQEKPIDVSIAIGAAAFGIGLSLIAAADAKIASQFAFMVAFLAAVVYLPSLVDKIGWTGTLTSNRAPGTTRAPGAPGVN